MFVKAVIHNAIEHLEGQIPIGLRVELFVVEQYVNKFFEVISVLQRVQEGNNKRLVF